MSDSNADPTRQVRNLVLVLAYAQVKDAKDRDGKPDFDRQARFLKVVDSELTEEEIAVWIDTSRSTLHRALAEGKKTLQGSKGADDSTTTPKK